MPALGIMKRAQTICHWQGPSPWELIFHCNTIRPEDMMKTIKYTFIAAVLTVFSSCSESWLEPEPLSFYTPENVYQNREGLESLLIKIRKDMVGESHSLAGGDKPYYLIMEYASSDLGSPWSQLDFYKLTPNTDTYYNFLKMF